MRPAVVALASVAAVAAATAVAAAVAAVAAVALLLQVALLEAYVSSASEPTAMMRAFFYRPKVFTKPRFSKIAVYRRLPFLKQW